MIGKPKAHWETTMCRESLGIPFMLINRIRCRIRSVSRAHFSLTSVHRRETPLRAHILYTEMLVSQTRVTSTESFASRSARNNPNKQLVNCARHPPPSASDSRRWESVLLKQFNRRCAEWQNWFLTIRHLDEALKSNYSKHAGTLGACELSWTWSNLHWFLFSISLLPSS